MYIYVDVVCVDVSTFVCCAVNVCIGLLDTNQQG